MTGAAGLLGSTASRALVDAAWTVRGLDVRHPEVDGGEPSSLRAAIELIEELTGATVPIEQQAAAPGDPDRTAADLRRTTAALGWVPTTSLRDGLAAQVAWHRATSVATSSPA